MKYEPIVETVSKTIYRCPVCHFWSEDKGSVEYCMQKHGDIPEFVKMIEYDLTAKDFYLTSKIHGPDMLYALISGAVLDSAWKEKKNVDDLETLLIDYQWRLKDHIELVDKILNKIKKYRYCKG